MESRSRFTGRGNFTGKEADVRQVADLIIQLLEHADDKAVKEEVAQQVHELTSKYPIEE